ncbi:MAG: hypothetical protein LAO19_02030 [Acidobacteriia bacterium]|nr:hypothetical protein [Terriglobia bacterium]
MRGMQKMMWFMVAAVALVMFVTPASYAQLNSGATTVALNATLAEALTLNVAPTNVTFTLVPSGTANGNSAVTITTTWVLGTTRTGLTTYAYFTSTTALIDAGTDVIPTSKFNGSVNGGAYSAFTGGAGPFGANSKTVYNHGAFAAGQFNGNHTDTLGLQIDTTGLNLPAGAYSGTLNIQAQAI